MVAVPVTTATARPGRVISDPNLLVPMLNALKPGESLPFYEGEKYNPSHEVKDAIVRLRNAGRIITLQQRAKPPMSNGTVNYVHGVGTFKHIAFGVSPKAFHVVG